MEDDDRMDHDEGSDAPLLRPGQRVALCETTDATAIPASLEREEGEDSWVVRFDGPGPRRHVGIFLRAFDEEGLAWGLPVDAEIHEDDSSRLTLRRAGSWSLVFSRSSARIEAQGIVFAESATADHTFRLSLLDISGTGCRVSVVGRTPAVGDVVRLIPDAGTTRRIPARVRRVDRFAFGRSEIGLNFEAYDEGDRELALAWRDRIALGAAIGAAAP